MGNTRILQQRYGLKKRHTSLTLRRLGQHSALTPRKEQSLELQSEMSFLGLVLLYGSPATVTAVYTAAVSLLHKIGTARNSVLRSRKKEQDATYRASMTSVFM